MAVRTNSGLVRSSFMACSDIAKPRSPTYRHHDPSGSRPRSFVRELRVPAGRFRARLHHNRRAAGGHARSRGFRRSLGRDAGRAPLGRRRPPDAASRHALFARAPRSLHSCWRPDGRVGLSRRCRGLFIVWPRPRPGLGALPPARFGPASAQLRTWVGRTGWSGWNVLQPGPREAGRSACTPGLADGRRGSC